MTDNETTTESSENRKPEPMEITFIFIDDGLKTEEQEKWENE